MRKKIQVILMTLLFCCLSTSVYSQKITFNISNVTVKEAIESLKEKTGYSFVYEANDLDTRKIISVSASNKTIEEVLKQILQKQNVVYEIKGKNIIVSKKSIQKTPVNQKSQSVTGVVTDQNSEPVIGASVFIKDTKKGTVTDISGKFSFEDVSSASTIVISYIGYKTQQIGIEGKTKLEVKLVDDNKYLDELVVVGYGVVKRQDLTGAIASVKGTDIASNPVANVAQALQGKLAGVNVTTQDGRPGATVSIRVRGGGSITQSNDPLYIVDGIPVGSISDLSSSEVESIDVLKDAASTAIYGARGANGVILVTTKSGKSGRIKVSYDGYYQVKNVVKIIPTLSAQDYVLYNWSYAASRGTANQDAVEKYFGLGTKYGNHYTDYANVETHDYTNDILRNAMTHSHNITMSGGNDNTKIFSSIGFINDEGIKINSDYNRLNAALKVHQKIANKLNADFDVRYTEENRNGNEGVTNGKGSAVSAASRYRPIDNPLGGVNYSAVASGFSFGIANIDDMHNPVSLINDITNRSQNDAFRGTAALSWEIIHGLTARTEASLGRSISKATYYEDGYTHGYKTATLTRGVGSSFRSTSTLNYNLEINKSNKLTMLLGNEILKSSSEYSQISGQGYPTNFDYNTTIGLIQAATTSLASSNSIGMPINTMSFFGRLNYSLLDRYLLTMTARADGSSKFASNNRWGYFPAAALAWRIHDESFMENTKEWLSNLKLRLSLGTTGSDNINPNLWQETWTSIASNNDHTPINGQFYSFYRPGALLANPDLKWETTISRNIGLDFGLWGKINGSLEIYKNTTKDLLMAVPVNSTTGFSYQFQNFGQTSNKGIELSLNAEVVNTKNFRFNVGFIYNYNMNNLDELPNADQYLYSSNWASSALMPKNDYMFIQGRPIGVIRGYISEGFYTANDFSIVNGKYVLKTGISDISNAVTATYKHPFSLPTGQTAFPGSVKFKDVNGDGKVDLNDATDLGDAMAHHTGSFNLNFSYKNFDLSSNFNWVLGGKIYNVAAMINASGQEYDGIGVQKASWVASAYKIYNVNSSGDLYAVTDPTELNTLNAGATHAVPFHQSGITSSEWIEDGSYLRLQTLTLGYKLPSQLLKKLHIENVRFYGTVSNLFTITKYSGIDPEVNSTPVGQAGFNGTLRVFPTLNMDFGSYPRARSFTFGANITF